MEKKSTDPGWFGGVLTVIGLLLVVMAEVVTWTVRTAIRLRTRDVAGLKKAPKDAAIRGNDAAGEDVALPDVATQHMSIVFSSDFTCTLSVFRERGVAKRRMRAVTGAASSMMQQKYRRDHWDLPDFCFGDALNLEDAVLDTEKQGGAFLAELLRLEPPAAPVEPIPTAFAPSVSRDPEEATRRALAILQVASEPLIGKTADAHPVPIAKQSVRVGARTQGVVVEFGMRKVIATTVGSVVREPEALTFELILQTGSGQVSFRGIRLQELFSENEVAIGDLLEITVLGKSEVQVGEGLKRKRNEYHMRVLQRARETA